MQRTTIGAAACLFCGIVLAAGLGRVYGVDKADKKSPSAKEVKELMAKAHKGDKSPLADLTRQLQAENPEWGQVNQDVKVLGDMAEMLRASPETYKVVYTGSADAYITSTKALDRAAQGKDRKAAAEALTGLQKSCAACHYYGGIAK